MLEKLFDNPSYLIVDRQWPMSMTEAEMKQVGFGYTGDQKVYRFPNGFGASLVQICILRTNPDEIMPYTGLHPVTDEPLWEVGVVQFNSDDDLDFTLTFDTTVADDVLRFVTDSRAELILRQIKELPPVLAACPHA